jgi:hypothetical protein
MCWNGSGMGGATSTASSKSCFAYLDGWNKIVGKHIIQSPLNLKLVVCTMKEFLISTTFINIILQLKVQWLKEG